MQKIKLLLKLILFALPLVIYYSIFANYDIYNYFGTQEQAIDNNHPIPRIREWMRDQETSIILGDSRMAHVTMDKVNDISGESYANLAFGGASSKENIDTFWFVANEMDIKRCVFQISFYTLNKNYNHDRVSKMQEDLTNPFRYMLNLDYNKSMLNNLFTSIKAQSNQDSIDEINTPDLKEKQAAFDYELQQIYNVCSNYEIDYDALNGYIDIAKYCNENNIELVFVTPPMSTSIWEKVVKPLDLNDEILEYKQILSKHARIVDMEYPEYEFNDSKDFVDPFHFYGDCNLETTYLSNIFKALK